MPNSVSYLQTKRMATASSSSESTSAIAQQDVEMEAQMKWCKNCEDDKPCSEFYKTGNSLFPQCKSCTIARSKEWRLEKKTQDLTRFTFDPEEAVPNDTPQGPDSLHVLTNPLIPGMVKVGRSHLPHERAKQLSVSQPFELVASYLYEGLGFLEPFLHRKLKPKQVQGGRGREWFRLEPEQADTLIRATQFEHGLGLL